MNQTSNYKTIEIDSSKGGGGDIWMRLSGFYSVAAISEKYKFKILIPVFLKDIAEHTFGSRLIIITKSDRKIKHSYTSLGLKDLLKPIIKGARFISPYQRAVIHDKRKRYFKDHLNLALFDLADYLGLIQLPATRWIEHYQGYLEIIGIKKLRNIGYDKFVDQLKADAAYIQSKLQQTIPVSSLLKIPRGFGSEIVIFPTGTGRQFVPLWWAKKNFPSAYYAFFSGDEDAELFSSAGLKTIIFFGPGDIVKIALNARWVLSTDSFPSHLIQSATKNCTILITGTLRSRIISPVFEGKVVNAEVSCHPCLHKARKVHPECAAGFTECLNWKNDAYTQNIYDSIKSLTF